MTMSRILITGAAGSIGKELVKHCLDKYEAICAFDNNEDGLFNLRSEINVDFPNSHHKLRYFLGDIRDQERLINAFKDVEIVFHCAALKHVALCEYNPGEAVATNIQGTKNVIEAAINNNVRKVILTSSDKAVNPSSAMGATKLVAERLCISANSLVGNGSTRFCCVRFGNVWNTNGSVGKIFKRQIKNKQQITITDKRMTRFFVKMEEAINLCIFASERMEGGETFVLDMGIAKVVDIANELIHQYGDGSIKEVGASPGEKLYEELFTDVESMRTILIDDVYLILPEGNNINNCFERIFRKYKNDRRIGIALRSDNDKNKKANIKSLIKSLIN